MREFGRGVSVLVRGFAWWKTAPGPMSRGLIPAAIVSALLAAALVSLAVFITPFAEWATPFADSWPAFWAVTIRVILGGATIVGALVLATLSFTALTITVGEPFYDRIWRSVETTLSGGLPAEKYGFWRTVADALSLVGRGLITAVLAGVVGLVPFVGSALSPVLAVTLTGWILADELSSRALTARGIGRRERRALLRSHRARALGFGIATQLCFLVPLGAIAVMPAAVAGSTLLARSVLPQKDGDTA